MPGANILEPCSSERVLTAAAPLCDRQKLLSVNHTKFGELIEGGLLGGNVGHGMVEWRPWDHR